MNIHYNIHYFARLTEFQSLKISIAKFHYGNISNKRVL